MQIVLLNIMEARGSNPTFDRHQPRSVHNTERNFKSKHYNKDAHVKVREYAQFTKQAIVNAV